MKGDERKRSNSKENEKMGLAAGEYRKPKHVLKILGFLG